MLGIALNNLGVATQLLGEKERGTAYIEESLEVRRRIGDVSRIALSLFNLGSDRTRRTRHRPRGHPLRRGSRDRNRDRR